MKTFQPIRIEPMPGTAKGHSTLLAAMANVTGREVCELFNDEDMIAHPGESATSVYEEWRSKKHKKDTYFSEVQE